ncbi:deoxyguanosinetriphosphate triphosphohydrolase [bacterium]|nr:MAG: deoxyguanosinetriphosphate triphosphohydrolase [bacterium]
MNNRILSASEWERKEKLWLAPYAVHSAESRGRHYPEPKHPYRPPFERDRERIIHSSAFRRLQYKTQVFVNHEGDHYRTRMSHTLEVATVGRVIARVLSLNVDLVEAIGLAHDLGHTPFGHTGEQVLNELTQDIGGFEHNRQSLRVVEYLEMKYPDFPGLNLTAETREGIIKHSTRYDQPGEKNLFTAKQVLPSLEAQIVNVADELAYTAHDIDDGLNSKVLVWDELEKGFPLWGDISKEVRKQHPEINEEMLRSICVKTLINTLVTDVLEESQRRLNTVDPKSLADVEKAPYPLIGFSATIEDQLQYAGKFLYENMYRHYKVLRMATKARIIIESLFKAYMDEPRQLPKTSRTRLEEDGIKQVVTDYIAGMTDRYAMLEYKKLFDPYERLL